jgi:transposase
LTVELRQRLEEFAHSLTFQHRFVERARIILHAADGMDNSAIARCVGIARRVVVKWRSRFAEQGMPGLADHPRTGRPPRLSALDRHEIIAMACHSPEDYGLQRSTWTIATLREAAVAAKRVGPMSETSVWKILNDVDLKPHKYRMWLFSKDLQFEEKMRDIVRLYLEGPGDGGVVICVDEKTSIQALERKYRTFLGNPGRTSRIEFEYIRHGTLCLFASLEVHTGQVFGWTNETRKRPDFMHFLDLLAERYPQGKVHVVLDNLNTHKGETITKWNEAHGERFVFHYTPTHASWLNQVEIWFGILSRQRLKNASFQSKKQLRQALLNYIEDRNAHYARPFEWTYKGYPLRAGEEAAQEAVAQAAPSMHTADHDRRADVHGGQPAALATPVRVHPWTPIAVPREGDHALPRGDHSARAAAGNGRQDPVHADRSRQVHPLSTATYRPVGTDPLRRITRRARGRDRDDHAAHGSSLACVEDYGMLPPEARSQELFTNFA